MLCSFLSFLCISFRRVNVDSDRPRRVGVLVFVGWIVALEPGQSHVIKAAVLAATETSFSIVLIDENRFMNVCFKLVSYKNVSYLVCFILSKREALNIYGVLQLFAEASKRQCSILTLTHTDYVRVTGDRGPRH